MSYLELAKSVRAEREKALLPTPEATPQGLAADMERRKFGSGVAPVGPQSGNTIPCPTVRQGRPRSGWLVPVAPPTFSLAPAAAALCALTCGWTGSAPFAATGGPSKRAAGI